MSAPLELSANGLGQAMESRAAIESVAALARSAALELEAPADPAVFRPASDFQVQVEPFIVDLTEAPAVYVTFLSLMIRDLMQTFAGDVPYEALGESLDAARTNLRRSLRAALRDLADELAKGGHDFRATTVSCSRLASQYFSEIRRLNERGGV